VLLDTSTTRQAACKRGIDELENILEWLLRDRPRALAIAKHEYEGFCLKLYRKIQRAQRERLRNAA
jgi:hypothetical protein